MARVAVAFNDDLHHKQHLNDIEQIGEAESGETAREVAAILSADLVAVGDDVVSALRRLQSYESVFNLCEGVRGIPRWEMHFAAALEMLGVSATGADPLAVALCTDKPLVKRLLSAAAVSVPRSGVLPAIVKPSREDAGVGIDSASIVFTEKALRGRVAHIERTYGQPALVEEFIDGREFNQAMYLGNVLPPGEVVFSDNLARHQRIVGWKAKWSAGSVEDRATVNRTPAQIDRDTASRIALICRDSAAVLGIGGYCRFDLRERPGGELCVIDVNPNPDIGQGSGFRKALDAAGIAFSDFLGELMMAARSR